MTPPFPDLSRHPIFCNNIIQYKCTKINHKNNFFHPKEAMVNDWKRKEKSLFTRVESCDRMYLVKIGHFAEICRKNIGRMQTKPEFSKHSFVVFYQPFSCKTAVGLKYKSGAREISRKRSFSPPH